MDDPTKDDRGSVLYVRSTCMVCLGKTYHCHYCSGEGKTYVEASDRTIARWINDLNKEKREDIMKAIGKGNNNGISG